jgi:putative cell wall-binding protein
MVPQTAMEWRVRFYNMDKQSTDIPLIFFSIAFFIILLGLFSRFSFKSEQRVPATVQNNTSTKSPIDKNKVALKKIDYNKPITCDYSNKESTISAKIDDTKIAITIIEKVDKQYVVVNGDCMYKWSEKEKNEGQKKCGIGTYMAIGKQLLNTGLSSSSQIFETMTKKMGKTSQFDINSLLDTCSNATSINGAIFTIPKDITFK